MTHSYAPPSTADRQQRRAARVRPTSHPYLRRSSSLAGALGAEEPALASLSQSTEEGATTSTNTFVQYAFEEELSSRTSSSSLLPGAPQQYDELHRVGPSRLPARGGDESCPLPDYGLFDSAYQPPSSSSTSLHSIGQQHTSGYPVYEPALCQPAANPLIDTQLTGGPESAIAHVSTYSELVSWDSFVQLLLQAADSSLPHEDTTAFCADTDSQGLVEQPSGSDVTVEALSGPSASSSPAPTDLIPGASAAAPPNAQPIPATVYDTTNPPSLEEHRAESAFWGGRFSAPLPREPLPPALAAPASEPALRPTIRIPLPAGHDEDFSVPIIIGDALGLHCDSCQGMRRALVNSFIAAHADCATMNIDYAFPQANIYVHRGWYKCDPIKAAVLFNSASEKKPGQGFTLGHLLTMMVDKQYKHWHTYKWQGPDHCKDLRELVGPKLAEDHPGIQVRWGHIYLVAVRRIITSRRKGEYHYFPELEIRL